MYHFIKAMYNAWCDGQDDSDIRNRYKVFILLACKHLHRSEDEITDHLKKQPWFKWPG